MQDEPRHGYDRPVAEYYDHIEHYVHRPDLDFFVKAATASGGPVLEIGSGTGRILIPTARAGVQTTGLELAPTMIDVCRRKVAEEDPEVQARIEVVQGDMCDFELDRSFPLITLPFRSFQHLVKVEDQIRALDCLRRHLDDDGQMILDITNPWPPKLASEEAMEEKVWGEPTPLPDGGTLTYSARVTDRNYFRQTQDLELVYTIRPPEGEVVRHVHRFTQRYLYYFEAEHLLARCGLRVVKAYGSYNKLPYGWVWPGEMILVIAKVPTST